MEKVLTLLLFVGLVGCTNDLKDDEKILSPIDNKLCVRYSMHSTHVTVIHNDEFKKDDGTFIKLFFTGGTYPDLVSTSKGILTVSCPSYGCSDQTYFFYSFKEDK